MAGDRSLSITCVAGRSLPDDLFGRCSVEPGVDALPLYSTGSLTVRDMAMYGDRLLVVGYFTGYLRDPFTGALLSRGIIFNADIAEASFVAELAALNVTFPNGDTGQVVPTDRMAVVSLAVFEDMVPLFNNAKPVKASGVSVSMAGVFVVGVTAGQLRPGVDPPDANGDCFVARFDLDNIGPSRALSRSPPPLVHTVYDLLFRSGSGIQTFKYLSASMGTACESLDVVETDIYIGRKAYFTVGAFPQFDFALVRVSSNDMSSPYTATVGEQGQSADVKHPMFVVYGANHILVGGTTLSLTWPATGYDMEGSSVVQHAYLAALSKGATPSLTASFYVSTVTADGLLGSMAHEVVGGNDVLYMAVVAKLLSEYAGSMQHLDIYRVELSSDSTPTASYTRLESVLGGSVSGLEVWQGALAQSGHVLYLAAATSNSTHGSGLLGLYGRQDGVLVGYNVSSQQLTRLETFGTNGTDVLYAVATSGCYVFTAGKLTGPMQLISGQVVTNPVASITSSYSMVFRRCHGACDGLPIHPAGPGCSPPHTPRVRAHQPALRVLE